MRLRVLRLAVILAIAGGIASRTTVDAAEAVVSGRYAITSWTDQDGLPMPQIWSLAQTRDGYLWAATSAGLVRFDGQAFKLGVQGVPEGEATTVYASRGGGLWVALDTGQVSRVHEDGRVQTYGSADGLNAGRLTELLEDRSGIVWAGGPRGLFRLNGQRWEAVGSLGVVTSLYENREGRLLVGSAAGAYLVEPARAALTSLNYERIVNSFSEGPDGELWVTDDERGYRLLRGASALLPASGVETDRGFRLLRDADGSLWIGTAFGGLVHVRQSPPGGRPSMERFMTTEGLAHNTVRALLRDREGNLWVGTVAGLTRVSRSAFSSVPGPPLTGAINALSPASGGGVWVATTEGLIRYDGTRQIQYGEADGLPTRYVTVAVEDARGTLWVGTTRGVARFANGKFTAVPLPDGSPEGFVRSLTVMPDGAVWILGNDGDVVRLDGQRLIGPRDNRTILALTDSRGNLWLGYSNNGGVERVRDGVRQRYLAEDGLGSGRVNAITEANGVVWAATNVGLSRLTGDRFVTLDRRRLPAAPISVTADRDGHLWLGVGTGFLRLDVGEFDRAIAEPDYQIRFNFYDSSDGAPGTPLLANSRGSVRAADGSVWFATRNGVAMIRPDEVPLTRQRPAVTIESIAANQEAPMRPGTARLPRRAARLQIDYLALSLSSPWVRFRYMLEGFDPDWIDAGTNRQAVYTNLRPGDYRFRVEAANKDWSWSEPAVWEFSIEPAFYETAWFYAVCCTLAGLLVWAAWQVRIQSVKYRLAAVYSERARVARELHDTLLQSLVGVAWQLDSIRERPNTSPEEMGKRLSTLRTRMEGFIREARDSIWNLRSPTLVERDLPAALREAGRELTAGSHLEFSLAVSGTPRRLSPNVEQQLFRIGQEALTNAIRHAEATAVRVELRFANDTVMLRVVDDGHGFDPAAVAQSASQHWGLTTMEERLRDIGGHLSLVSTAGKGTVIEATAPLSSAA